MSKMVFLNFRIWVVVDILVLLPFVIAFILISWDIFRKKSKQKQTANISKEPNCWDKMSRFHIKSGRWVEKVIFGEEETRKTPNFRYRYPTKQTDMIYENEEDDDVSRNSVTKPEVEIAGQPNFKLPPESPSATSATNFDWGGSFISTRFSLAGIPDDDDESQLKGIREDDEASYEP